LSFTACVGLREDRVDQLDDRRVIVAFEQIGGFGQILRDVREIGVVLDEPAGHLHCRVRTAFILQAQQTLEIVRVDAPHLQRQAEDPAYFGHARRLSAGAVDGFGDAVDDFLHQHTVAFAECKRERRRGRTGRSCGA
jgi:hypothetical protein